MTGALPSGNSDGPQGTKTRTGDTMEWQTARILIIGKNYPSLSKKHAELSCTGGLLESAGHSLIRLYPIPYRLLDDSQKFRTWQWIEARVMKDPRDTRPESWRIDPNTIEPREHVGPNRTDERRRLIEACPNHYGSVPDLEAAQESRGASLGIVRPREITDIAVRLRTPEDNAEWVAREKELLDQQVLFDGVRPMPLEPPGAEFSVSWLCHDAACPGHTMGLKQWGVHQLWRRLRDDPDVIEKIEQRMEASLDLDTSDLYFFLGNFGQRPRQFGLMDVVPLMHKANEEDDGPRLFQ